MELADFTYLIPKSNADEFFEKILAAVDNKNQKSGWYNPGGGKSISGGELVGFSYGLQKGLARCGVQGLLI